MWHGWIAGRSSVICAALLWACLACALFTLDAVAQGNTWLQEIEITSEPERKGKKDFTVRILPGKTHDCDKIIFECIYHQEFPWEDARGRKYTKIHEPVTFKYRRRDIKLVDDLDTYVSFRVPISMKRLATAHGRKVFNKNYPVSVARLKIKAVSGNQTRWSHELKATGVHKLTDVPAR